MGKHTQIKGEKLKNRDRRSAASESYCTSTALSLAPTSLAYRDAMAVGFVVLDLLDLEAVELCRGSLPEMEAAPSREMEAAPPREARMEASAASAGEGDGAGSDGEDTSPVWWDGEHCRI